MALRSPSILAAVALAVAALGPALLTGCASDRETTLSRTARQREIQALVVARERLESEREVLLRRTQEIRAEIGDLRAESVKASAELRAAKAQLGLELDRLQVAEQDLAAVRARAAEIEEELQPLRALEQTLRDQEELRAAAAKRAEELAKELATVEAAAAKATEELQPRIDALKAKLAQAQQAGKAITDAEAALQAAGKVLAPPPPPPPPDPKKKK